MKESIENAKRSGAVGRVGKNPEAFSRNKQSFYTAMDYNQDFKERIQRQNSIRSDKDYRFAIVGTGPAGFYMAKNIIKTIEKCRVDLIDRNPHPFGLIRTGVAPDHQAMKRIENDYQTVLDDERCNFFGNVWVGDSSDAAERGCYNLSLEQLR